MPLSSKSSTRAKRARRRATTIAPGGGETTATRESGAIGLRLIVAAIARVSLAIVYAPLKLLPTRRKVVMISREHTTTPDDFLAIRDALARLDESIEIIMLVKMVRPGLLAKIGYSLHMLRQLFHIATARVLIVDTYAIVASVLHHKPDLTVIQIWHALGAFKKFGLSILGHGEGRDERLARAMKMHEGYDIVLASGEAARAPFAEAFGTAVDRVVVAPLPRVDQLRDPARSETLRTRIFAAHPHLRDRRIAVFAPTFRLDGGVSIDVRELVSSLASHGVHAVVKLHPLMSADFGSEVDTAPGFSTQDLLHVADLFITDYSSALFEAAVVGVPCYFIAPDLDEFFATRDFYLDYRHDLPGPISHTLPELSAEVARSAATREQSHAFARQWVAVPGDPAPAPGASPCADHIAHLVYDTMNATRTASVSKESE